MKIGIILLGAYIGNKVLRKVVERAIRIAIVHGENSSEIAEIKREDTLIRIFHGALQITLLSMAVLMILSEIGIAVGPILAGLGVVGLAVGFGGQYLIRDVIAGLFIILEDHYSVGDVVDFNGKGGLVEDISLRITTLRDLNGTVHHVPHGEIKISSNLSKNFARVNIDIGISYNSDLEHVISVINTTGLSLSEDPDWREHIIDPPHFLRVDDFADSAIIIKILGETQPIKQWDVSGEFRKRIKIAFDKEGIEIPFPQMVVHHNEMPQKK